MDTPIYDGVKGSNSTSTLTYILSGSFRSTSLFLLAFSPTQRSVSLVQEIDAYGPHQYLSLNPAKDRAFATSWALPPALSSWEINRETWTVSHLQNASITAMSSYTNIPPPFTHVYSAGGPTGEVHAIDPVSGGFGNKLQEILFVPEDQLAEADMTRSALRNGSHAVEFSSVTGHGFIPDLGTQSIEMYKHDKVSGLLTHVFSSPSPRGKDVNDGPRHVKIHPNGKILYCVTEHTNVVDAYRIRSDSLEHVSSRSLLPAEAQGSFRGDTLMLAPSTSSHPVPNILFTTTRGSTTATKGFVATFRLDDEGLFSDDVEAEYWQTPTSGGKANALDVYTKQDSEDGIWILLTDDDDEAVKEGDGVKVLEWDGWGTGGVKYVTGWPSKEEGGAKMQGGSHAVWLD